MVLGGAGAEGAEELWRVAGIHRESASGTVVSVAGAHELRLFDGAGNHVRSYGRRGSGPREFHEFASMKMYTGVRDRLSVDDRFNGRMHILNTRLTESQLLQLRALPGLVGGAPRGLFTDGFWLAVAPQNGGRPQARGKVWHFVLAYHRVSADWTESRELVRVASRPRVAIDSEGRQRLVPVPFTVDPVVVTAGDATLVVAGGAAEIRRYDANGVLQGVHSWSSPARPTREHWSRYQRHALEIAEPGRRPLVSRMLAADIPLPKDLPRVQNLIVDEDGLWWAERYRLPWETESDWDVLAPDGRWLSTVGIPAGIEVQQTPE